MNSREKPKIQNFSNFSKFAESSLFCGRTLTRTSREKVKFLKILKNFESCNVCQGQIEILRENGQVAEWNKTGNSRNFKILEFFHSV